MAALSTVFGTKPPAPAVAGVERKKSVRAAAKAFIEGYRSVDALAIAFRQIASRAGFNPGTSADGEGGSVYRILPKMAAIEPSNGNRPVSSS